MKNPNKKSPETKKFEPADVEARVEAPVLRKGVITAVNLVAVRKYPVVTAPIVGYVKNGDRVDILKSDFTHFKIVTEDKSLTGYVFSKFCTEE